MPDTRTQKKVVFVSGNFYALHPGHLRLLRFAKECGHSLVVGVNNVALDKACPPPLERAEALRELSFVDRVVVLENGLIHFLKELKPDIVVKGKEFETQDNPEEPILKSYGGRLLLASGEPASYSGSDLLLRERDIRPRLVRPVDFAERHSCRSPDLRNMVERFSTLKVVVVGDFITDEYIDCAALGLSREDPTVVVTPQTTERFIGGAGIVAAHARAMGADVSLVSMVGRDQLAEHACEELAKLDVKADMIEDESRPTTLKQRFRAGGKTLLRVSHLRQHSINRDLKNALVTRARAALEGADLLIFADFNYGLLPQPVVDELVDTARKAGILIAADSQSSSQFGDISRFRGAALLTPTEHELRLALRDQSGGVAAIGHELLRITGASAAFITLGAEGVLIVTPAEAGTEATDRLPAFNVNPVDAAGAGDSMLVAGAMALAVGGSPWQAGYLGSVAAGIQTGRLGNVPIKAAEMLDALS